MIFFLDSVCLRDIKEACSTGLIDGITTNPSLIARSGVDMDSVVRDICCEVSGPVSVEVMSDGVDGMLSEADRFLEFGENVVVKIPASADGFVACKRLCDRGVKVNITLCFSVVQALLAAKAGAEYVSVFIGRVDDAGYDGLRELSDIREMYDNYGFRTKILAASVRSVYHIAEAAKIGADVVTIPMKVFRQLSSNLFTESGIRSFSKDWKEYMSSGTAKARDVRCVKEVCYME
ncbi:transaldolase family protein [Candidatus Hydrogenosomobacter endosymbioticus]|uniref:Transaldolase n=1 Tax=Candidatus Hydrogenosomobacter endosymbioticus TaxID=2558174 RepID=A0ABM7V831_9PROT|nr:transaldolase family protein [Candidatus Hydrogenosomobacter endosymbioticus]BDB95888.1 putative transaldolase [Candidatus Hydrogenosomobacter endosymbioticus]